MAGNSMYQTGRAATQPKRQMEKLNRGLVAVKVENGVYIGWHLFGTEPERIGFNLYRNGAKVNASPITGSTNYLDTDGTVKSSYFVKPVIKGTELEQSETVNVWNANYLSIPLQIPKGGVTPDGAAYTYNANDASVGDVDGDGQYEIILKWEPSNAHDNAHRGYTGNVNLDCYKLDGTLLWRIDLGRNIRAGAHYTQFLVYDFNGDGKAEIVCKTADGTIDGAGVVIGDAGADFRNENGFILDGPEFLTVFEGATGRALATVDYDPPRGGRGESWGDAKGNRVDRFLACAAYIDGVRPSIVMCRGYYARTSLTAYNWRDGQLSKVWTFDSRKEGNAAGEGQGNHNLSVGDVDGDGRDEIVYGSCVIDHDGTLLYSTGFGHGDAMHFGDLDPDRPGLEVFQVHEKVFDNGVEMHDAATGEILWGIPITKDAGRGTSADIDPRYKGEECWSAGCRGLYDCKGYKISDNIPSSINFAIWWDGDLLRELLDRNRIDKWDYMNCATVNLLTAEECSSNNGSKATPCLQADIFGDWREEVIWRKSDNTELRIYTTTDLTEHCIHTLMHDPVYRLGVAWQNVAYNQPPHTGFYLGYDMEKPPMPDIYTVEA